MELNQPTLQWLLSVGMITGFTSLTVSCYILKRDNKKLALELAHRQSPNEHPEITMPRSAVPASKSELKPIPAASPLEHQDIRHFVAQRSRDWFAPPPRTS